MRTNPKLLSLLLALLVAGACRSVTSPLGFDAGAAMHAVREDAAEIARRLDRGELPDAVTAAHRLATLRIAPGHAAPPEFRTLETEFREEAALLVLALETESRSLSQRRFESLLDRCDACHARYRAP